MTKIREFLFLMVLPFIVWVISWWGFISGKLALGGDAFYYYWDSRFFLDNISRGVYPLWNPDYSYGVPWNFFLRRMGEVNPFYWIISFCKFLGFSALHAHLIFFVFYYFLGLVGFWFLAKLFLKDRLTSTGAYLLLLFSWGGQLFYCFDVLMFVPLVWFFYFLFAFAVSQKKHQFLGVCFCAALMISTYIPFFTFTIIAAFLFFLFLFYVKESFDFFKATFGFMRAHKFFTALSLGFFILACIPAGDFYLESRGGGFVMPSRHVGSTDPSQLAIVINSANSSKVGAHIEVPSTVWDIVASGYFDKVFSNQRQMGIGDFNIAYLFFIVLILSVINPILRQAALLLVSGVFLTLVAMTSGRLYPFLLEHVFFFRYMRMLQLFLWLAILPIAILFVMEQLRVFLKNYRASKNIKVLIFVITVHVLFFGWLLTQEGVVWSSYLAVVISLVFFIQAIGGVGSRRGLAVAFVLSLTIQPIMFAWHINQNSSLCNRLYLIDHTSHYQGNFLQASKTSMVPVSEQGINKSDVNQLSTAAYYANPWITNVGQFINQDNLRRFVFNHLLLFDNSIPEDQSLDDKSYSKLSRMWGSLQNSVFLPTEGSVPEDFRLLRIHVQKAQVVTEGSPMLKVVSFDANTLRLQTSLDHPQFLLWTDGYHPGWHVFIDGREGRLLRADVAFKGTWVPSGSHAVMFRFETPLRYVLAFALLFLYVLALFIIVALGFREGLFIENGVMGE